MGLLDSFNPNFASSPQFQQGLLAMALASGNPRQAAGIQGLLQMQQQQEENKLNQQYRQAQIEKMAADQQKAANLQKMAAGLLGGGGFMQGQPSKGSAGSNGGMLGSGGSGGAVQSLTPDQVLGLKMMGIDATDVWKETRPDMQVSNGYAYDRRNIGAGFMPSLQTTTDGKSVMTRIGPDGLPVISAPSGALDTFNSYQRAASSNKPMEVFNPSTGRKEYVTESQVTDKAKGLSPMAGTPGDIQSPGYNGGSRAAANADAIAIMQRELMQPGVSPADQAAIRREIARMQQQTPAAANGVPDGNYAAGPSPDAAAAAEAAKVTAVETAKSNVGRNDAYMKDVKTASKFLSIANQAESLLKQGPTASGIGSLLDSGAAFFAQTTKGAEIAQQLKGIGGWMVSNVPRMEGPQSNFDVANYQVMAGDVANDSLPIARRLSALQGIKTMMEDQIKLAGTSMQGGQQAPQENQLKPAKTVVRTGMHGGRKVVQYSDGTTDYAD